MKPFTASLLAAALSAAFASASAADAKPDQAQYRNATAKAASDYTTSAAACKDETGNAKLICQEEAKVARARAELDAVTEHNNTKTLRAKARTAVVNAEYALAKLSCADDKGAEKTECLNNAKSVHTAALVDVKADRDIQMAANADSKGAITNTSPKDADKRAAVAKCEQIAGSATTGCLIDNKGNMTAIAGGTAAAGAAVANRTENVAERAVDKTKEVAKSAVDKTKEIAHTAAVKTERAVDNLGDKTERAADKTERAADRAEDRAENSADRAATNTGIAATDTAITTKVKAGLFKEPELKALDIHVETEKGVVMLSGFVDNKNSAERAVKLAKGVDGVKQVKSAIKVK